MWLIGFAYTVPGHDILLYCWQLSGANTQPIASAMPWKLGTPDPDREASAADFSSREAVAVALESSIMAP